MLDTPSLLSCGRAGLGVNSANPLLLGQLLPGAGVAMEEEEGWAGSSLGTSCGALLQVCFCPWLPPCGCSCSLQGPCFAQVQLIP